MVVPCSNGGPQVCEIGDLRTTTVPYAGQGYITLCPLGSEGTLWNSKGY